MMWKRYSMKAWGAVLAWVVIALTGTVQGDDNYYEGPGDPSRNIASWHSAPLWTLGRVPTPDDRAVFDYSRLDPSGALGHHGVYLADFWLVDVEHSEVTEAGGVATIASLLVDTGSYSLIFKPNFSGPRWDGGPAQRGGLVVDEINHAAGILSLIGLGDVDGRWGPEWGKASVDAVYITVAGPAGMEGYTPNLKIADAARVFTEVLVIGTFAGTGGILRMESGAALHASVADIALAEGSVGDAFVRDGSHLNPESYLQVGVAGQGTLTIEDAGIVSGCGEVLGSTNTGNGHVSVGGDGSALDVGWLAVGESGQGVLDIGMRGRVISAESVVGWEVNSNGEATLSNEATWENHSGIVIGDSGAGSLTLVTGGVTSSTALIAGHNSSGSGHVVVSGRSSQLNVGWLFLGISGVGILEINERGTAATGETQLGAEAGSHGQAVLCEAAHWTINGSICVGQSGQGDLTISDGATLTTGDALVGDAEAGAGHAAVDGTDSAWSCAEAMTVGKLGQGTLTVSNGGRVTAQSLDIGELGVVDVSQGGMIVLGEADPVPGAVVVGFGGHLAGSGLIIGDAIACGGVIEPGHSPGTLSLEGNLDLDPDSQLVLEFAGPPDSGLFDQILVSGSANLAGSVTFDFNGFTPQPGMTYDFLIALGGQAGAFTQWQVVGLPDGMALRFDPATGQLSTAVEVSRISLFYNHSAWDDRNAAANAADDHAIARQGGAAARRDGDVRQLHELRQGHQRPDDRCGRSARHADGDDFLFRMGNNDKPYGNDLSHPADDWPLAPDPIAIVVRPGAGQDGADRVTLIWADAAVRNCWLQVTMLATDATGLARTDVFYVGNAVGESGIPPPTRW